ncbi:MAG: hypothetical protein HLUCCX14_05875 [Marinobacter excellens HL-55]|uniref:Uncharacterized protein n=1 Tax=Marinobacter excellens HL-55 TaxID=1305731 RepID=A0A0P7Z4Q9_9GAMM|nr:MAG: hypothetical protein HLUCCX14_05875 [Marinobacter excellens HL-55]
MFRIHVERLLNTDINTVFEAIADHARSLFSIRGARSF